MSSKVGWVEGCIVACLTEELYTVLINVYLLMPSNLNMRFRNTFQDYLHQEKGGSRVKLGVLGLVHLHGICKETGSCTYHSCTYTACLL